MLYLNFHFTFPHICWSLSNVYLRQLLFPKSRDQHHMTVGNSTWLPSPDYDVISLDHDVIVTSCSCVVSLSFLTSTSFFLWPSKTFLLSHSNSSLTLSQVVYIPSPFIIFPQSCSFVLPPTKGPLTLESHSSSFCQVPTPPTDMVLLCTYSAPPHCQLCSCSIHSFTLVYGGNPDTGTHIIRSIKHPCHMS